MSRIKLLLDVVNDMESLTESLRTLANAFLYTLRKQENLLTEFDEKLWCSLVDYATVYDKDDVRFTFKDGTKIKV